MFNIPQKDTRCFKTTFVIKPCSRRKNKPSEERNRSNGLRHHSCLEVLLGISKNGSKAMKSSLNDENSMPFYLASWNTNSDVRNL